MLHGLTYGTIARNASQAKYPAMRKTMLGGWYPCLGVTGNVLRDVSGRRHNTTMPGTWGGRFITPVARCVSVGTETVSSVCVVADVVGGGWPQNWTMAWSMNGNISLSLNTMGRISSNGWGGNWISSLTISDGERAVIWMREEAGTLTLGKGNASQTFTVTESAVTESAIIAGWDAGSGFPWLGSIYSVGMWSKLDAITLAAIIADPLAPLRRRDDDDAADLQSAIPMPLLAGRGA